MKQFNGNVLSIVLFEVFLGTGTMEWINSWTNDFQFNLWLVFAIYALLLLAIGYLAAYLAQFIPETFDGCTMFDYFLGSKVGGILNLLLMGTFLMYAGKALLLGARIIHYAALPYTPTLAIVLFGLLVPVQLVGAGWDALLRFQVVAFWPNVVLAALLLVLSFRTADFSNLLPVVPDIPSAIAHSFPRLTELLPGLMLLVVFLPLFRRHGLTKKHVMRSLLVASICIILWNLLNLLVVLSVVGSFEAASLQWPVLEAIRLQRIPNIFLERLDLIFLFPMLTAVVSCANLYACSAHHVWSYYLTLPRRQGLAVVIAAVVLLSQVPNYVKGAWSIYNSIVGVFELILFCLLPVMYFIIHVTKRERHPTND